MRYVLLFAALALGIMAGWAFEAQAGGTCTNSFCTDYKASCTDYDLPESSGCLGHLRENGCVIWDCYRCEDDNPAKYYYCAYSASKSDTCYWTSTRTCGEKKKRTCVSGITYCECPEEGGTGNEVCTVLVCQE